MSQDFNTTSKKSKRGTRAQRNQPVLVTSGASEQEILPVEETPTPNLAPITLADAPDASPAPKRRIAGFFSTVGKEDTATTTQESDIAKARIARATRGKAVPTKATTKEVAEAEKKADNKPTTTTRSTPAQKPKSLFKPRYIFGMLVYLIAADFLGGFEANILTNLGVERLLTTFNLFGFAIKITPSGLTFIATLIIILIVLVRLDFLPTNLNSLAGNPPPKRGTTTASRSADGDGPRAQPPTLKQGVQGADDDLYRAYRTNQRREKKRS